jgi:N-acetyl-gamma-glutamyl-phosphate reductase
VEAFEPEQASELAKRIDVAFCALPHGASSAIVGSLYEAGLTVVDLSADYRLSDLDVYTALYGEHLRPNLLEQAVYGLPELHREELRGARLIAAPGCYPTSSILPLAPLLKADLVESGPFIIDAKSGVSGAGKSLKRPSLFSEASEGMRPYSVAGKHRHTPEIEQELGRVAGSAVRVTFTPQLAPMIRGILTCTYARAKANTTRKDCVEAAKALYADGLTVVFEDEALPDTLWVRGSARAHVAYALDERTGLVLGFCAIDNLAKGASAQAIQAYNVAQGWPDGRGLPLIAQFP